ncbi:hypothetical protein [Streptomyces sp. NPDC004008]
MSKELRRIEVACTVHSAEHLPQKDGEQMHADDVIEEMRDAITAALDDWYQQRGHELLATEPLIG